MRPIPGATHMSLRIQLYQRALKRRHWRLRNDVPGLGIWVSPSDPSLGSRPSDVFAYHQAVGRLVVPYFYRFRVAFRWRDDDGRIVGQASATTAPCRQPDLRPDLTLRVRVNVSTSHPDYARYVVFVRNGGRSIARRVVVQATFPAHPDADRSLVAGRVRPAETVTVSFVAPRCSAADPVPPLFAVDPMNAIEESDETNNSRLAGCPPA